MQISTTRFGTLSVDVDDLLHFPARHGRVLRIVGIGSSWPIRQQCGRLAAERRSAGDGLGGGQSAAVRGRLPDPRDRGQLTCLALADQDRLYALCVVSKQDGNCVMNLRAPVLINLTAAWGVRSSRRDEQPVQVAVARPSAPLQKSA